MKIRAIDCNFKYSDGTEALKNLNFEIGSGELVFLTGASGSGKTSTTRLMLGMDGPTAGAFEVLGVRFQAASMPSTREIRALRRRIGTVFQSFRLIPGHTALDNVMLPLRFGDARCSAAQRRHLSLEALARVGLVNKAEKRVETLSQGEAQRVAIARAIVTKPELLIADEPTGNLDPENSLSILKLLASLAEGERAVVITTHAVHLIDEIASPRKRRLELRSGELVQNTWMGEGK